MDQISRRIGRINNVIGKLVSWFTLAMVIVTFAVVILRYWFDFGWIWLQESVTWMHAAVFMLAAAYTLEHEGHVRVDIFYRNMSPRRKAIVDAVGTIVFLIPLTVFLLWTSYDYVATSWNLREVSVEAGGLAYPMPSIMKSFIPITAVLLLIQESRCSCGPSQR